MLQFVSIFFRQNFCNDKKQVGRNEVSVVILEESSYDKNVKKTVTNCNVLNQTTPMK